MTCVELYLHVHLHDCETTKLYTFVFFLQCIFMYNVLSFNYQNPLPPPDLQDGHPHPPPLDLQDDSPPPLDLQDDSPPPLDLQDDSPPPLDLQDDSPPPLDLLLLL